MRDGPEQLAARRTIVIVVVVGAFLAGALVVGLIATLAVRSGLEVADAQRAEAREAYEQARERALVSAEAAREADELAREILAGEDDAPQRAQVEGWFSEALQAMALEGLARGWAEVRDDPLPADLSAVGLARFREEVEALPARIGRELAEQRDLDELVEAGIEEVGVFEYLELLDEDRIGPFPDLVGDAVRFGDLFSCNFSGPVFSGREFATGGGPGEGLADGTTLSFPRGVTRVNHWTPRGTVPRCLTIEGQGMDATLLIAQSFHDYGRVEQLVLRDCTLMAASVEVLDFRGRGSQVRMERVRVIGFDAGAGSSNALGLDQTALLARDCRFEGGYGRSPRSGGTLFDVRTSALLARFERCRFDSMTLELEDLRGRATVVFADCVMTDLRDRVDPRTVEHPGILLVSCSVRMAEPDPERKRDWSRDLDELFPGWREGR